MITSHFIGIFLKSDQLNILFNKLQTYIYTHNLTDVIKLVNPDFFHITLYYLDSSITTKENKIIKDIIFQIKKTNSPFIKLESLQFFKKESQHIIGYLNILENNNLITLHERIKEKINHEHIDDNKLDFIPHCTLFRIKNNIEFLKHKKTLSDIIEKEVFKIKSFSTKNLHLVAVDSTKSPQSYKLL